MGTLDRISLLLTERKISQKDLTDYLGVDKSTFSQWKKGTSQSYNKYLSRIAEFFKVSVDWLTGDTRFRTTKELIQCCDSWEIGGDEYFNPPYDFCGLIKEMREDAEVTIKELSEQVGLTFEQYEKCEEGLDPISYEQAEMLCDYFSTTVKQVLFDNALYEPESPVPEEYLHDIDRFEKVQQEIEEANKADFYAQQDPTKKTPSSERIKILARHLEEIPDKDRDQLIDTIESTIDLYLKAKGLK